MKNVRKKQDKKTEDILLDQSNRDINDLANKIREQVRVYYASDSLDERMRDLIILTSLLINCKSALINFNLYELEAPYDDISRAANIIKTEIENVFKALGVTYKKGEQNGK